MKNLSCTTFEIMLSSKPCPLSIGGFGFYYVGTLFFFFFFEVEACLEDEFFGIVICGHCSKVGISLVVDLQRLEWVLLGPLNQGNSGVH